ncbi:MAG TPA: EAL domain-containing protein [Burkholderiaceae bacterium]|jgi:EAL domain-containing protein (putative c-di-GMP-specific phosphodiesterase class I)
MKTEIAPAGTAKVVPAARRRRAAAPLQLVTPLPCVQKPDSARIAAELDRLILEQDFEIHFQPIVGNVGNAVNADLSIFGYEALTRPPQRSGFGSPLALFEAAAELGRLIPLERVIVRKIVRRFAELGLPGRLFINVSADTLVAAEHRLDLVATEIARHKLPASRLVVELTETRAVLDPVTLTTVVKALRAMGFAIALDDLGEGFAGLKRWLVLRPDFVKIDRYFVDGIADDPLKQVFVRSILEMGRSSGATVIAEGLERRVDLQSLQSMGTELCQGFLFARPQAEPPARVDFKLD